MSTHSPDDPATLARLAQTVIGSMFDGQATLVAGRVPEGWPPSLIPPPPVTTLGGMAMGKSLTTVFVYPPGTDSPLTLYRAFIEARGWTSAHDGIWDGFDSARIAMLVHESTLAQLRKATSDPTDTSVIVSLTPHEAFPARHARGFPHHSGLTVPRLARLPGVHWDSGGGSNSGGGGNCAHSSRHIRITSDLAPDELLPLYARQLADAGWSTGPVQTTPASAIQWLEATDERRQVWRGLLAVYVNGPAREVFIYMATGSG